MKSTQAAFASVALLSCVFAVSATDTVSIDVSKKGHEVSPDLWGIFFEDINFSIDGGVYAELVRNRSFEDGKKPDFWTPLGTGTDLTISDTQPVSAKNVHSLYVEASPGGGVANEGYFGIHAVKGADYVLSVALHGEAEGPIDVSLESQDGRPYGTARIPSITQEWKTYKVSIASSVDDPKARLAFRSKKGGVFFLDCVSLFPRDTYKGHVFRKDLMEMLAALHPSFMRFPGGCWVEGNTMKESYRWKKTIGDIWERPQQWNLWGYWATHGVGYHEYLQLAEDLGAAPLFCINVGMSHSETVPMEKMGEYVQDALDAIEYANGPVTSEWGAKRAAAGHPASFHLRWMEIGNENGEPGYNERYALFFDAIRNRYPDMRIIANNWRGNIPRNRKLDLVDEHYYSNPEFFFENAAKYDSYRRSDYHVFVGEYAVTQNTGNGSLRGAIGEAAFMVGMERNSDVVQMAAYAPLFVNANHRRWNPDLIVYDSSRAFGIPSYYVQKLFSANRGATLVDCQVEAVPAKEETQGGKIGIGTWNTQAEFKDVRVTGADGKPLFASDFKNGTKGWAVRSGKWTVKDGAYRQTDMNLARGMLAVAGEPSWRNYMLTLKARKISGQEGFLICTGINGQEKSWWNLGGWGNTWHGIEMPGVEDVKVRGTIEPDRWYDVKVSFTDTNVTCWLDGKLVHNAARQPASHTAIFADAALSQDGKELIVKVVNGARESRDATLHIHGAELQKQAKVLELTVDDPMAENSFEAPFRVAPKESAFHVHPSFTHAFPGNSFTVIRIPLAL